ncbi:hypothetical protein HDV05_004479 [Chytridiales sp. JEL 0842]|nr:hypothetical protein HDV05_004479 [Chytridiales sp. JEL 0842]
MRVIHGIDASDSSRQGGSSVSTELVPAKPAALVKFHQVLDRSTDYSLQAVNQAFSLAELFTYGTWYLARSTVRFSLRAAEETVSLLDGIFGSTETSRAIAALVHLIREEISALTGGTGFFGTIAVMGGVTKALTAFACLQLMTSHRTMQSRKLTNVFEGLAYHNNQEMDDFSHNPIKLLEGPSDGAADQDSVLIRWHREEEDDELTIEIEETMTGSVSSILPDPSIITLDEAKSFIESNSEENHIQVIEDANEFIKSADKPQQIKIVDPKIDETDRDTICGELLGDSLPDRLQDSVQDSHLLAIPHATKQMLRTPSLRIKGEDRAFLERLSRDFCNMDLHSLESSIEASTIKQYETATDTALDKLDDKSNTQSRSVLEPGFRGYFNGLGFMKKTSSAASSEHSSTTPSSFIGNMFKTFDVFKKGKATKEEVPEPAETLKNMVTVFDQVDGTTKMKSTIRVKEKQLGSAKEDNAEKGSLKSAFSNPTALVAAKLPPTTAQSSSQVIVQQDKPTAIDTHGLGPLSKTADAKNTDASSDYNPPNSAEGVEFLKFFGIGRVRDVHTDDPTIHSNHYAFSIHTRIPINDILLSSYNNQDTVPSSFQPPIHYVCIDRVAEAVVITLRGTLGLSDVLTDMRFDYAPFLEKYRVHAGMLHSATLLWRKGSTIVSVVQRALRDNPGYGLVLVGHSLGGGIATILALQLSCERTSLSGSTADISQKTPYVTSPTSGLPVGRPIVCYSVGSPCVVSYELSVASKGLIFTLVNGGDIIPTMSLGLVHDLKAVTIHLLDPKNKGLSEQIIAATVGMHRNHNDNNKPPTSAISGNHEDDFMWSTITKLRETMKHERLYPAGTAYWMNSATTVTKESKSKTEHITSRVTLQMCDDVREFFKEPIFSSKVITDHTPSRYEASIDALVRAAFRPPTA